MASLSKHHETLTDGIGKCSVPLWRMGVPAGFCDKPAYGRARPFDKLYLARSGTQDRYDGYVPALACYHHGGPARPEGSA